MGQDKFKWENIAITLKTPPDRVNDCNRLLRQPSGTILFLAN